MKYSIYNNFGALNSAPVLTAVESGLKRHGHAVTYHNDSADVAVIWSQLWAGRMRPNQQVWNQYRSTGRPVLVVEVGAIQRGHTWRLMTNGENCIVKSGNSDLRFQQLGMQLHHWKNPGHHIVIACQRPESQQWPKQLTVAQWLAKTVNTIRKHSNRIIHVRPHPRHKLNAIPPGCVLDLPRPVAASYDDFDFDQSINSAWCVVNFNSNPAVSAVLQGVPVFVDVSSMAAVVGNTDLAQIENPLRPDRQQWAWDLAHTEWRVEEIAKGIPWN